MIDLKKISTGSDPQKTLKVVLSLAAIFLVLWVFVLAQNGSQDPKTAMDHGLVQVDSLHISLNPQTASDPQEHGSFFVSAIPVFLVLLVIMAGIWFWQKKKPAKEDSLFTVIGRQQLAVGQQIIVIHINEEYWVLSTSGKDVSLMHRYSNEEWKGTEDVTPQNETSRFLKIFTEKQEKYVN